MEMMAQSVLIAAVTALAAASLFAADGGTAATLLKTKLVAHAGKGYGAPENTLPAFQAAIAAGFGFECDIQMSADHQIFAAHNPNASSYGGRDAPFKEMQWSEIAQIDVGLRLGGQQWAGTPMPRFEDILASMRDGKKSFVEVKESAGTEIVPYIKAAIEGQSVATPKNMLFISFDREICRALRQALPAYEVMWIIFSHKDLERPDDQRGPAYTADEVIALLREANLTGVDMVGDKSVATEAFVREVKGAGFSFGVWTVDDTGNARIFLERGVDAVTTNRTREIADELADWNWTDVCGNEVKTYVEDGETKTYRFISFGDPRIDIGEAAVSAASHFRASTVDEPGIALASSMRSLAASSQALEGRYFTLSPSEGTALRSDKRGLEINIR